MKKLGTLLIAILVSIVAFGQKKELKRAERAFIKKDMPAALEYLLQAEILIDNADQDLKTNFYVTKGEIVLASAGRDYKKMKEAAEAYKMARELDTDGNYESLIDNGVNNVRVALVNSAVADQSKNPKLAAEKLYLSYQIKKDTSDLYFAAGNALNAKDYDQALNYYETLMEIGYTGIQKEYIALRKEDEKIITFASKEDRDSEMISGKYLKPEERMSKSARGEMLRKLVLIYSDKGQIDKASSLIADARKENPDDMSLVRAEAKLAFESGDIEKANKIMEEIFASGTTDPQEYFNAGVMVASVGKTEKAKQYYEKALELKPDHVGALVNLSIIILAPEKDIVDEMNSLGMSKADTKTYDELTLKRRSMYQDALPYLEAASKAKPADIGLVRARMNAYSQLEMSAKVKEMKTKISEMGGE
ncbi:MAG: tetratricopeptide (TPR) repeat protein [Patiriisocius sp.]|jgi:tetratricopeptide (TPR) repeat protein